MRERILLHNYSATLLLLRNYSARTCMGIRLFGRTFITPQCIFGSRAPPKNDRASTGQRHGAPFADVCTRRVGSQAPFKTARGLPTCGPPPRTPSAFLGRTRRQLAETGVTCTQRARAECKPSCRSQADLQSCPSSPRRTTSGATKTNISLLG